MYIPASNRPAEVIVPQKVELRSMATPDVTEFTEDESSMTETSEIIKYLKDSKSNPVRNAGTNLQNVGIQPSTTHMIRNVPAKKVDSLPLGEIYKVKNELIHAKPVVQNKHHQHMAEVRQLPTQAASVNQVYEFQQAVVSKRQQPVVQLTKPLNKMASDEYVIVDPLIPHTHHMTNSCFQPIAPANQKKAKSKPKVNTEHSSRSIEQANEAPPIEKHLQHSKAHIQKEKQNVHNNDTEAHKTAKVGQLLSNLIVLLMILLM